jgi:carboxypeptidase T
MTVDDHAAFVAMGKKMASLNGYKAEQSSDLYITDGDQIDWLYGAHRIFSFTWELYPPETSTVWGDHYPPDENIAPQTARNRSALLYFLDIAGCPYRAIGKEKAFCGPFNDNFEIGRGWAFNPYGTDTATSGTWALHVAEPTSVGGVPLQLGSAYSGQLAMVTGALANGSASANDVDGGSTTMRSAPVVLPSPVGSLTFRYYFAHAANSSKADSFLVYVQSGGVKTLVFRELGTAFADRAKWAKAGTPLTKWAGKTVRFVFVATDGGPDSTVEVGVDDVHVEQP